MDCAIDNAYTHVGNVLGIGGFIELYRCGNSTNGLYQSSRYMYEGNQRTDNTVYRSNGANITSGFSWKIQTTANAKWYAPFNVMGIIKNNSNTGNSILVTVEGVADPRMFASLPNTSQVWTEVEYLGDAVNYTGTFKNNGLANVLSTPVSHSSSTELWDAGATSRTNGETLAVGDIRKVATNPGRLFICSTGGALAGSEPAAYASAVDGDSFADGAATMNAMWRFKQNITLASPNVAVSGSIFVYPKIGMASANVYIDPHITLS